MQLKLIKRNFLQLIGNIIIVPIINVLCKTLSIKEKNQPALNKTGESYTNAVFAFWHGTMIVPWFVLKNNKPCTIISQSKDGDILVKLLNKWNYNVKRGSSSKGGKEVLDELISEALNKNSIAITPDGPRGPKNKMKAGAVIVSKKAQIPIILLGVGCKRKMILRSWDSFEIPYFFSKINIFYSDPIYINSELSFDETDEQIKILNNQLNKIQKEAENFD
jgi:lysophospholipid acyltransferase (LPLAT)-like uncharacterized protein